MTVAPRAPPAAGPGPEPTFLSRRSRPQRRPQTTGGGMTVAPRAPPRDPVPNRRSFSVAAARGDVRGPWPSRRGAAATRSKFEIQQSLQYWFRHLRSVRLPKSVGGHARSAPRALHGCRTGRRPCATTRYETRRSGGSRLSHGASTGLGLPPGRASISKTGAAESEPAADPEEAEGPSDIMARMIGRPRIAAKGLDDFLGEGAGADHPSPTGVEGLHLGGGQEANFAASPTSFASEDVDVSNVDDSTTEDVSLSAQTLPDDDDAMTVEDVSLSCDDASRASRSPSPSQRPMSPSSESADEARPASPSFACGTRAALRRLFENDDAGLFSRRVRTRAAPAETSVRARRDGSTPPRYVVGAAATPSPRNVRGRGAAASPTPQTYIIDHVRRCIDVGETIGIGSFSRVKIAVVRPRADDDDGARACAVKVCHKARLVDSGEVASVLREKAALATVAGHPMIMELYGTHQDQDRVYFVFEYLPGGELFSYLHGVAGGRMPAMDAQFHLACLLDAFEHAHARGVLNRDCKPENVVLDNRGYPKLCDWGFARTGMTASTKAFTVCGTLEYLPREVLLNLGYSFDVGLGAGTARRLGDAGLDGVSTAPPLNPSPRTVHVARPRRRRDSCPRTSHVTRPRRRRDSADYPRRTAATPPRLAPLGLSTSHGRDAAATRLHGRSTAGRPLDARRPPLRDARGPDALRGSAHGRQPAAAGHLPEHPRGRGRAAGRPAAPGHRVPLIRTRGQSSVWRARRRVRDQARPVL